MIEKIIALLACAISMVFMFVIPIIGLFITYNLIKFILKLL